MSPQQRPRIRLLWWCLAPLGVLLVAESPLVLVLARLIPLLMLLAGCYCIARLAAAALAPRAPLHPGESLDEAQAHRHRLARLAAQTAEMEACLAEARRLQEAGSLPARGAAAISELTRSLALLRQEAAAERAAGVLTEALHWFAQLEPLLSRLDTLDEAAIRAWSVRLPAHRAAGEKLLCRLRADQDAAATALGVSTRDLLEATLQELDLVRAELVTVLAGVLNRRAHRLLGASAAVNPPDLPRWYGLVYRQRLTRLRDRLEYARASRELRLALQEEPGPLPPGE
jgi:hypothetical protein